MSLRLLDNEQVVCTLEKTPLIWVTPTLLGFFSLIFFSGASSSGGMGFIGFVLLVLCIVEIIRRYRYAGYVSNKRIALHYGLFLHEKEMRFEQLEGVQVERYKAIFWHRLLASGTGGGGVFFDYLANHDEFKSAIYEAKEKNKTIQQ